MSGFRVPTAKKKKIQFESPKIKLSEFVMVHRVSNWAKFAVQISKGWSSNATANSRAFVHFRASIVCPSRNFENPQRLSNSTKLWTKDIAEVVNNSGNKAASLARILFLFA